ncbi:acetamidase/formamidase family protein [Actinoplanes couchii]|uniref:Amidase n=1 Tax=Actinoplanes couchii TaxID=403638 RepID=A0ABQ3XNA1_9ACTN|nr:acetamidase/formamidase family protein [Actinoplanes couchii]GID59902.1 amidase [Actinoplanes couchii]
MGEHHTYIPTAKDLAYTFGGMEPVASLRSGDTLTVFTEDCFGGAITIVDDLPSRVCTFPYLNPVTGPFFIEDAEPGDTLAVHFLSIVPARSTGVSSTFPHFGALTSTFHTATLQPPLEERVWLYDIDTDAGMVRFHARASDYMADLPLAAMHGTIGVAPAGAEARSSITCDSHGGNMDTPELRVGTTLYLGVNVRGALLSLGDGHARQGQGEVCGVAVEVAMTTTIAVEVIKGVSTPWPRIESDTGIMSVGCARPLEDAFRISQHDLVGWTARLTGLDVLDAYQLVSQAGTAPVGNVVDPNYTMLASLPKHLLRGADVYNGAHHRLHNLAGGAR